SFAYRPHVHSPLSRTSGRRSAVLPEVARTARLLAAATRLRLARSFDGHVSRFRSGHRGRRQRGPRRYRPFRRTRARLRSAVLEIREQNGSTVFVVRVQPRASKDEISGVIDGALKIRLRAPALENRANEALCEFLASLLKRPKTAVRILGGER